MIIEKAPSYMQASNTCIYQKETNKKRLKKQDNALVLSLKIILVSCISIIFFLSPALSNHYERSYFMIFAQTDQRDTTAGTASRPENTFSAIGQISSLAITVPESGFNITNTFKVILTGEWNLSVKNGTVTNFAVDFLASPMDGGRPHIHQITNFKPYANEEPSVLKEDKSFTVNGTADIKINGLTVWDTADISISISKGNSFNIDPDDEDTEGHFGDQQVYGVVTRLIS
jgi:hypothetical protein